ncbi:hypothetical protein ACHAQA_010126 [Verticillium albo-atrum]
MVDKNHTPHIKELGLAILDSRRIFSPSPQAPSPLIKTHQFSTSHSSKEFEDCDWTDFNECVFTETFLIAQEELGSTVISLLQIQDGKQEATVRPIVVVGHSVQYDLNALQRIGVDVLKEANVVSVLDTHPLSIAIIDSPSSLTAKRHHQSPPIRSTLSSVLTELGCEHSSYELHNAGNDATYTLHAMLSLAIRWAEGQESTEESTQSLERLRAFVKEIRQAPRWKPVRKALGAHADRPLEDWELDGLCLD